MDSQKTGEEVTFGDGISFSDGWGVEGTFPGKWGTDSFLGVERAWLMRSENSEVTYLGTKYVFLTSSPKNLSSCACNREIKLSLLVSFNKHKIKCCPHSTLFDMNMIKYAIKNTHFFSFTLSIPCSMLGERALFFFFFFSFFFFLQYQKF